MEFALSPQFNFDMGIYMNPCLEYLEDDDDEFYAEMRRQIMILTGDQYDDFPETKIVKPTYSSVTEPKTSISISSQGFKSLWQNEYSTTDSVAAPVQPAKSSGISKGTGVFIPKTTVKSRKNNKPSM